MPLAVALPATENNWRSPKCICVVVFFISRAWAVITTKKITFVKVPFTILYTTNNSFAGIGESDSRGVATTREFVNTESSPPRLDLFDIWTWYWNKQFPIIRTKNRLWVTKERIWLQLLPYEHLLVHLPMASTTKNSPEEATIGIAPFPNITN